MRGGSKSIPLKNIKPLAGRPLVYYTMAAACACAAIDTVYIATDSAKIRACVESLVADSPTELSKVRVIERSAESASDTASTESAMLEFAERYDFDNIVLIQATSPLLTAADLDRGFARFNSAGIDTVLSVVRQKRFCWWADAAGLAQPTNYDVFHRPRRQEYDGYFVENGAFYISSRADLLRSKNRLSGSIGIVEMSEETFFEIDEPSDWVIIEGLLRRRQTSERPLPLKMVLTDCDGCLTDAGMYYSENGDELKKFNTRDGMAFRLLRERGIKTGIITGESRELVRRRAVKLGVDILELGCTDKLARVREIVAANGISLAEIAYIGDDINDRELLTKVGLSACPADAMESIRASVDYVSTKRGGEGVLRDVVEHYFIKAKQA